MFTYTYVLEKSGLLVDFMKKKCAPSALKDPPTVKNPVEAYGFEKSCYFACCYLKDLGLTNKLTIENNLFLFNQGKLLSQTKSQESKLKEYNLIKKSITEEKKKNRAAKAKKASDTIKSRKTKTSKTSRRKKTNK